MANVFDPATGQWAILPDMEYRRWYPTATTLADGRALVIAGSDETFTSYIEVPEVFDPQTNSWTTLNAAQQRIPNYAFVYVLPDGRVIAAGSDESPMATYVLDVDAQAWSVVDPTVLDAGSGVMYLPGKIMKAGGSYVPGGQGPWIGVPTDATTYVLDMTQGSPTWQQTQSMAYPRSHLNLTMLPDGSVVAIGGSTDMSGERAQYGVLPAEMWSPATQTWTTMASMQTPRMYHSSAMLLPDGRILSAGGGRDGAAPNYLNAEIYSPPYLFRGARPTITDVPAQLAYGTDFFVQTPDAASIASVSLIRNGSVTHSNNMDQRYVPLSFTQTAGGLNVQAPADANLAPPGTYMLFIVNSDGVPSIAPFVRLPAGYEDSQPPSATTGLIANAGIGTATLGWNAATDDVGIDHYNVYRSTTPGFTPSAANLIAQSPTTGYVDSGLAGGTYYYRVAAEDAAGNIGPASDEVSAAVLADTVSPSVSITDPVTGASVFGTITISADAFDDVSVAGVQFFLDGNDLGG
ncbi:MAG: DUF1929 domain-containing protein, partial [Planctomycetes bacterium]|nr:DUF1929 domain-containing protein [Planctomycetota bacterium]